jgi:TonB family protein
MLDGFESSPLGLLPEAKVNWPSLAASYSAQAILLLFIVEFAVIHPAKLTIADRHLQYTPLVAASEARPAQHPKIRQKLLPPAPIVEARVKLPALPRPVPVRREQPVVAPRLNNLPPAVAPALTHVGGARPVLAVKTGVFAGSSAVPTINRAVQKVQTGGFGDPNGVPATGTGQGKLVMAKVGAFDMPQGGGYGNGSGGTHGARGTIASAGFGSGIASPGQGDGRSNGRGTVQVAGFGEAAAAPVPGRPRATMTAPSTTPVEIISKPRPQYTEEARQLKVEGEVLVSVLFQATGQAIPQGVVRGLGHGLDESALAAASRIRFKPATQNAQPVDSSAVVHVVFQLAY